MHVIFLVYLGACAQGAKKYNYCIGYGHKEIETDSVIITLPKMKSMHLDCPR